MIIEEAAEVLEQHIVTALTKHCKHLILVGNNVNFHANDAQIEIESLSTKYLPVKAHAFSLWGECTAYI